VSAGCEVTGLFEITREGRDAGPRTVFIWCSASVSLWWFSCNSLICRGRQWLYTAGHHSVVYLECVSLVEVARQHGERNVDDDEREDRGPHRYIVDELLSQVVEHRSEVDGVDWSDEASTEPRQQVTSELHSLGACLLRLQHTTIYVF